ncbi:MAG: type III-B CRISPR-associated protein Cas10/Cmr2 [Pseudomonadota bacterium]|nr:type III-B CRISPR-associated protein Cas10/Cmr2 [Pseudomonadota bacterium]
MVASDMWAAMHAAWSATVQSGVRSNGPGSNARFAHPFSGQPRNSPVPEMATPPSTPDPRRPDPRQSFLEAWRGRGDATDATLDSVPADRSLPLTGLRDMADIAAREAAIAHCSGDAALLSVSLGPVQPFIAAGRSLRDLWTGSAMLSWLSFRAMTPLLELFGPTCLVLPALRGNAIMDAWLATQGVEPPREESRSSLASSIPHRFLAVVPVGGAGPDRGELLVMCRERAQEALSDLATTVRDTLDEAFGNGFPGWADRFASQVEQMLDVRGVATPLSTAETEVRHLLGLQADDELWPGRSDIRRFLAHRYADGLHVLRDVESSGWPARVELASRMLEAAKRRRSIPVTDDYNGLAPGKCTLLGTWEQVGPADRASAERFWSQAWSPSWQSRVKGIRLREGEQFCAPSMVKRFAMASGLAAELGLDDLGQQAFPDTATIAARSWLVRHGLDDWRSKSRGSWSGRWVHSRNETEAGDDDLPPEDLARAIAQARQKESPPAYYAVILCDGDNMGEWLSGERAPRLSDLLSDGTGMLKEARLPAGPSWHAVIARALSAFSTRLAPRIVSDALGTLVYSGGDDVLAFVPAETALQCARTLRAAFGGSLGRGNLASDEGWYSFSTDGPEHLTLGPTASLSAGIVFAHHKDNLAEVLAAARRAEKLAKHSGRDRFAVLAMRRSGEHSCAAARWGDIDWLDGLVGSFRNGASDRWAYALRRIEATLSMLPPEAAMAEIRRQVARSDADTQRLIGGDGDAAALVAGWYDRYRQGRQDPADNSIFRDFVLLCQAASFIARGQEQ